jgi:hypothetical protein
VTVDRGRVCVSCGALAPETTTEYTLIGPAHGWRLQRRTTEDGSFVLEWSCAQCWRRIRTEREERGSEPAREPPRTAYRSTFRRIAKPTVSRTDVLVIGDDRLARASVARAVLRGGHDVRAIDSDEVSTYQHSSLHAIVVDAVHSLGALISALVARFPRVPIVLRTADPHAPKHLAAHAAPWTLLPADAPPRLLAAAIDRALEPESTPRRAAKAVHDDRAPTDRPPPRRRS